MRFPRPLSGAILLPLFVLPIALTPLPGSSGSWPPAAHAAAAEGVHPGTMVTIHDAPYAWLVDASDTLRWIGDPLALQAERQNVTSRDDRAVEWTLDAIAAAPKGPPLLSLQPVRLGDAVFIPLLDPALGQLALARVPSGGDLRLLGLLTAEGQTIDGAILAADTWQARYGLSLTDLPRTTLRPLTVPRPPDAACEAGATRCIQVDAGLEQPLRLLSTIEWMQPILHSAAAFGVGVRFGDAHGGYGRYHAPSRTVVLSETLRDLPVAEHAALLAHELQHAADHAAGRLAASACTNLETRAFARTAEVWSWVWQGATAPVSTALERELGDIASQFAAGEGTLSATVSARYRDVCAA